MEDTTPHDLERADADKGQIPGRPGSVIMWCNWFYAERGGKEYKLRRFLGDSAWIWDTSSLCNYKESQEEARYKPHASASRGDSVAEAATLCGSRRLEQLGFVFIYANLRHVAAAWRFPGGKETLLAWALLQDECLGTKRGHASGRVKRQAPASFILPCGSLRASVDSKHTETTGGSMQILKYTYISESVTYLFQACLSFLALYTVKRSVKERQQRFQLAKFHSLRWAARWAAQLQNVTHIGSNFC